MRERHVAAAAVVEFLDARDVGPDGIAVLDAGEDDFFARRVDAARVGGGERESGPIRREHFGEAMDRVELGDRGAVRVGVSGRVERTLALIDGEKDGVVAARFHLGQVDLPARDALGEVHRVAGVELIGVDVDMRVERHDALVDRARLRDERVVDGGGPRRGRALLAG